MASVLFAVMVTGLELAIPSWRAGLPVIVQMD